MNITDIKIKLMGDRNDKLAAFCSIIIDDAMIIQDLKIIRGPQGIFVAMPSRKLTDKCPRCGGKNHLRSRYCNDCGIRLREDRAPIDANGRATLHADIAHPLNSAVRDMLQRIVLAAYAAELENSKSPGYMFDHHYGDLNDDDGGGSEAHLHANPSHTGAAGQHSRRFGEGIV